MFTTFLNFWRQFYVKTNCRLRKNNYVQDKRWACQPPPPPLILNPSVLEGFANTCVLISNLLQVKLCKTASKDQACGQPSCLSGSYLEMICHTARRHASAAGQCAALYSGQRGSWWSWTAACRAHRAEFSRCCCDWTCGQLDNRNSETLGLHPWKKNN